MNSPAAAARQLIPFPYDDNFDIASLSQPQQEAEIFNVKPYPLAVA